MSDCCLVPNQQIFSYIMARWWWGPRCTRPTQLVEFLARLTRRVRWAIAITWHPSSVRKHFKQIEANGTKCGRNVHLYGLTKCCYDRLSNMAARGHKSLWLAEILMIFFSDTTWRMELKIVMNDHCKLLTKCCYFLDRLKIQDGHQWGT